MHSSQGNRATCCSRSLSTGSNNALCCAGVNGEDGGSGSTRRNGVTEKILQKRPSVSPFLRVNPFAPSFSVTSRSAALDHISRRDILKRVGVAGAAAAVPIDAIAQATREAFETLTAAEGATLEAIVARLIPTDANGPGAAEARAARYIDRALGGFLNSFVVVYRTGLAGVESYARSAKGASFTQLSAHDQDALLTDMENN